MTAVGSWRLAMFLKCCLFRICMSLVLINNSFLKYYQLFSTKIINLKMSNLELFLTIICNVLYMRRYPKTSLLRMIVNCWKIKKILLILLEMHLGNYLECHKYNIYFTLLLLEHFLVTN